MKKILAQSLALFAVAASAAAEDFYFTGEGTPTTGNPSGAWSTLSDGSFVPVDRPPMQGEDNLIFDGQYANSNNLFVTTVDNYGNDMTVRNLSQQNIYLNAGRELSGQDVYWELSGKLSVSGVEGEWDGSNFTDKSKNFILSYTDDSVGETSGPPRINFSADSIEVMADGTTATDNMTHKAKISLGTSGKALNSITVNKGIDLYSRSNLTLNAATVKIGGIVNFQATSYRNAAVMKLNASAGTSMRVEVGGLVSNGQCAEISNTTNSAGTETTLVFKNAAGTDYSYGGKLMDGSYGAGDEWHLSKLNIEMDGDGIQRLSPQDPDNCFYTGTVTVKRGVLYLYNTKSAGDTYLEGGRLGVLYSGHAFYTTGFHWTAGAVLELDVKSSQRDTLAIGGILEKAGDGKLVFALDLTAGDYDAIGLGSSVKYDLLTAESLSNFGDSLDDDFEIFGMDENKFDANFLFADNTLSVVITHVPEPAALAAIIGAAALAIAAARRRK